MNKVDVTDIELGFLKPYDDENTSRNFTSYLPFYG